MYNLIFYQRNHLNKGVFIFHFNDGGILTKNLGETYETIERDFGVTPKD